MRIVSGALGAFLIYGAWYAFFHALWETPLRRALYAASALTLAAHFVAYALSSTYGKRRGNESPGIRFKDPKV